MQLKYHVQQQKDIAATVRELAAKNDEKVLELSLFVSRKVTTTKNSGATKKKTIT